MSQSIQTVLRPFIGRGAIRLFACFVVAFTLLFWFCEQMQAHAVVSIVDDAGQTIQLEVPARRIIPLYAGLSEILSALGLGDRVVGRTVSDDTLPASLPTVGTHMRPNPELVVGLRPDLVLQLVGRDEADLSAQTLMRWGIPVARFRVASFAGLFACIERLGVLAGKEQTAANLIFDMRARLDAVQTKLRPFQDINSPSGLGRPSVFFEARYPNLLGAGDGNMVADIIRHAGGVNCLAESPERLVRLNEERLLIADPDIYLVQQGPMNQSPIPVKDRAHFVGLRAVRHGFVYTVPEFLFSRPGPQSVTAVERLAGIIRFWHTGVARAADKEQ